MQAVLAKLPVGDGFRWKGIGIQTSRLLFREESRYFYAGIEILGSFWLDGRWGRS